MKYFFLVIGILFLVIGLFDLKKNIASGTKGKGDWGHFFISESRSFVIAIICLYLAYHEFTR
jgi:hypothetical protein